MNELKTRYLQRALYLAATFLFCGGLQAEPGFEILFPELPRPIQKRPAVLDEPKLSPEAQALKDTLTMPKGLFGSADGHVMRRKELNKGMAEKKVEKKRTGPNVAPIRWVCVSKLKGGVDGKPVTSETKGDIGTGCSEVQRRSLIDLGKAKATAQAGSTAKYVSSEPVPAEAADVFCKKEEFSTSCE